MNLISELMSNSLDVFIAAHICDGFCTKALQKECPYKTLDKKIRCIDATMKRWEEYTK